MRQSWFTGIGRAEPNLNGLTNKVLPLSGKAFPGRDYAAGRARRVRGMS